MANTVGWVDHHRITCKFVNYCIVKSHVDVHEPIVGIYFVLCLLWSKRYTSGDEGLTRQTTGRFSSTSKWQYEKRSFTAILLSPMGICHRARVGWYAAFVYGAFPLAISKVDKIIIATTTVVRKWQILICYPEPSYSVSLHIHFYGIPVTNKLDIASGWMIGINFE